MLIITQNALHCVTVCLFVCSLHATLTVCKPSLSHCQALSHAQSPPAQKHGQSPLHPPLLTLSNSSSTAVDREEVIPPLPPPHQITTYYLLNNILQCEFVGLHNLWDICGFDIL